MKYLGHFFVTLLLIGTCLLTQSLIAEDIVQVKSVQGRVIIRAPLSQDWVAVKKAQKLKVGWILQLMDGAAIELSLRGDMLQNSKSQAKELVVAIKVPLIIRIGSEMVRQTERVNIYLDELPVATGGPQIYSWQNAFTRINAALSPKYKLNAKSSPDDLQRQRQDIEVLENKSQIKLIQPSAVDLVLGTVPMRYTLRWSQSEQNLMEADPKTKFLVYIWKEDEERGEAFAKVNRLSPYT
ncbi:MAG: hypothetical protein NTX25_19020, partial [Proteobacteria bacterium]|nr:hypothetical protein [Pseudomonadota bacterium]